MKKILSIFAIALLSISFSSVVKAEEIDFGGSDLGSESLSFGGSDLQDEGSSEEIIFGGSDLDGDSSSDQSSDEEIIFGGSDLDGDSSSDNNEGEETSNEDNSSSHGHSSSGSRPRTSSVTGEVLGASTDAPTCSVLKTFMMQGQVNDVEEVKRLQALLNENLGTKLSITGFFGSETDSAVKLFQLKYKEEILAPWVELGTIPTNFATGYVYKTTLYKINKLLCPDMEIPMPILP